MGGCLCLQGPPSANGEQNVTPTAGASSPLAARPSEIPFRRPFRLSGCCAYRRGSSASGPSRPLAHLCASCVALPPAPALNVHPTHAFPLF